MLHQTSRKPHSFCTQHPVKAAPLLRWWKEAIQTEMTSGTSILFPFLHPSFVLESSCGSTDQLLHCFIHKQAENPSLNGTTAGPIAREGVT